MPELDQTRGWAHPAISATAPHAEALRTTASWRADALSLAAVLGLVLLLYAQLWLPGLVLIKRDAFQFFLPLKQYIIDRLSHGELPQWFPYEGLGRPLISLTVMGVFHPFTLLYWLFPVQDAYRLATLLSCLIGAGGTFLLARSLGISRTGAAIGAIGFSCSGYVASLTENVLYLYSICSVPLFLYVLDAACTTGRWAWLGSSVLVWAGIILNGDIQTAYYLGFVAFVWTVMRTSGMRRAGLVRLMSIVILTVVVAAVQLGPAWVAYQHSDRTDPSSFHAEAIHWSTHPLRLVTMGMFPIGDASRGDQIAEALFHTHDRSRGPSGLWAESLYLGPVLIGLALVACWRRRDMHVFVVLGALSVILAMGPHGGLYEVFYEWMPLWSSFRYPERLMGFATLALAMLAASGIDVIRHHRRDSIVWCAGGALIAGLGGWLATDSGGSLISDLWLLPADLVQHLAHSMARSAWWTATQMVAMGALLAWLTKRPTGRAWVGAALVLLLTLDLARANLPAVQTSSSEAWTFTPGLASAVANDAKVTGPGHFRILSIKDGIANVSDAVEKGLTSRERIAALRRHGLYLEHNAVFGIESIQHYLAGINPRVDEIGRNGSARVVARYNVAYFIGRPARFQSEAFSRSVIATVPDYDLALVRNPVRVTPRAYLSRRPESFAAPMPMLTLLEREEFLDGTVDGIESPGPSLPPSPADAYATLVDYRPETVRVEVETPQAAVLILTDAYEPGWTARIDGGEDLKIFRANGLVRAVMVPPGRSQVLFHYETPWLRFGAWCSGLGLLLTVLLFVLSPMQQLTVSNRLFPYQN